MKTKFPSIVFIPGLASMVGNSSYIDLETNERSHGREVVREIKRFLKSHSS